MAIVSISRMQHRRGLRVDLPANLNEAELGWCLDTRQLFIGNGNTFTGNSQILTQWSPNDEIITHTYEGYTGISANTAVSGSPTVRTLGSILDDYLDVKDYGAVGDGITDDTLAINAAIADTWARIANAPQSALMSRNTIFMPSGTYLISDSILLYPYVTLQGEGIARTEILLASGSSGPVARTADSLGQTGANIGTNGASLPTSITLKGMSIDASVDTVNPAVILQRCTDVSLIDVAITGGWAPGDGSGTAGGVLIESLGTAIATKHLNFAGVQISNCAYGWYADDPISYVTIENASISQCYRGIEWIEGPDTGPRYTKLLSSTMEDVDSHGLYITSSNRGHASMNNTYVTVGASLTQASIYWSAATTGCTTIGDIFNAPLRSLRRYNGAPGKNAVFDAQTTEVVKNTPTAITQTILANQINTATNITYGFTNVTYQYTIFIDYSIYLDTYRRNGRLSIITDLTTVKLTDTMNELNNDASVTFTAGISSGTLTIYYTSTGTTTGKMQYIETTWSY